MSNYMTVNVEASNLIESNLSPNQSAFWLWVKNTK